MIKIQISGAGGGKTTGLVKKIHDHYNNLNAYKKIFVITYTNYAVDQIINTYTRKYGILPKNVKIMTVHKFCIHEIIEPYYQYIFNKKPIENIVTFEYNRKLKFYEFSNFINKGCIHTDNIFSMAKWILCGKSNFKQKQKKYCDQAFKYFISDIDSIFIDEYQDLDKNFLDIILKIIDYSHINILIVGDPKQQIMGRDYSRWFITELKKRSIVPNYNSNCFRCGLNLLNISNKLCCDNEKQITSNQNIALKYIFYDNLDKIIKILETNKENFLVYMKESNQDFNTDKIIANNYNLKFHGVNSFEEKYIRTRIKLIIENPEYTKKSKVKEIKKLLIKYKIELTDILRKQLNDLVKNDINNNSRSYKIYSINKVKGLEANYCFYIIDNNFLKYLKYDNKRNMESNKIYVALTRAIKALYIVIPQNFKYLKELEELGFKKNNNF